MARPATASEVPESRKPLVRLHGEIKSPPFTLEGRKQAGDLLRMLQEGERLGMPHAEPLPIIGSRCGALRVRDAEHNWRIVFRTDPDAVLVVDLYAKKTRTIPDEVVKNCQARLKAYDEFRRKLAQARQSRGGGDGHGR